MDPVIVVGAGIAGISCARALAGAGVAVLVLERAGQPGGRMATAGCAGRPVDTGASYFTVSDDRFEKVVRDWQRRGLARPWTDTFEVYADRAWRGSSSGPLRWAAGAGLQTLVRDLAGADLADADLAVADLRIEQCEVGQVAPAGPGLTVDGRPAAAVVLAMPDPQARALLHPDLAAERAGLHTLFEPVLALSAGWPERTWDRLDGVFVNGDERLSWIADDGRRRGDAAPVLVAHSTPSWAARRMNRPGRPAQDDQPDETADRQTVEEMVRALSEVLGIGTAPSWARLDQWPHAKPAAGRAAAFQLWPSMVGACGDSWSPRPRVEAAFLSGLRLGNALAARLPR